jgi:DNA gyrase subunit B
MTDLIKEGYVYLAMPPLYKISYDKKNTIWLMTDAEKERVMASIDKDLKR